MNINGFTSGLLNNSFQASVKLPFLLVMINHKKSREKGRQNFLQILKPMTLLVLLPQISLPRQMIGLAILALEKLMLLALLEVPMIMDLRHHNRVEYKMMGILLTISFPILIVRLPRKQLLLLVILTKVDSPARNLLTKQIGSLTLSLSDNKPMTQLRRMQVLVISTIIQRQMMLILSTVFSMLDSQATT